jgi:1-acyl-sn-glycerol-3-phosphate acyltransferase
VTAIARAAAVLFRFAVLTIARICFRIRVTGAENISPTGPAVIISNHVSYADVFLLSGLTPRYIRFLMWQPLYQNPWLNPICRLFRAIPLPERAPKESLRALRTARSELEAGGLVGIFPEGMIASAPQIQPFQRGVEYLLRGDLMIPVVPVHLDGLWGHPLSRSPQRQTGFCAWFRYPVTVRVGRPVYGISDVDDLRECLTALGAAQADRVAAAVA